MVLEAVDYKSVNISFGKYLWETIWVSVFVWNNHNLVAVQFKNK